VVEVSEEAEARSLMRLMDALDEHDDVEAVHANFDIPESLLEQAAA
jgi:transcriptional/translational regulatory protein YebC/TACO1